jgi:hypothetical protein
MQPAECYQTLRSAVFLLYENIALHSSNNIVFKKNMPAPAIPLLSLAVVEKEAWLLLKKIMSIPRKERAIYKQDIRSR